MSINTLHKGDDDDDIIIIIIIVISSWVQYFRFKEFYFTMSDDF